MLDDLPATVIRCAADNYWDPVYVSQGCIALTGYHPEAFTESNGTNFAGLVHEGDIETVRDRVQRAIADHRPWEIDYRIRHRNGDIRRLRDRGKAIYGENGEAVRPESMLIEITAHTEREARLVETSEKLRHEIAVRPDIKTPAKAGLTPSNSFSVGIFEQLKGLAMHLNW